MSAAAAGGAGGEGEFALPVDQIIVDMCDTCKGPNGHLCCTKCKCAYYCSKECQKSAWVNGHKQECKGFCRSSETINAEEDQMRKYAAVNLENTGADCAICWEKITESPLSLACKHVFCNACLHKYEQSSIRAYTAPTCPLCRGEFPPTLDQFIYRNAVNFIRMGRRIRYDTNYPEKIALREHFGALAMGEYRKLVASGRILGPECRSIEASAAFLQGKFDESLSLVRGIMNSGDSMPEGLSLENKFLIVENLLRLSRFSDAKAAIHKLAKDVFHEDNPQRNVKEQRNLTHAMAECDYGLGLYHRAIETAEMAVQMNRHYDDVYKVIVLAYKALGMKKEAVKTMQRAIRYETPFHLERREELRAELAVLQAEDF